MNNNNQNRPCSGTWLCFGYGGFLFIVAILLSMCNVSCVTSKKAHKYFAAHPNEFGTDCHNAFPFVETSTTIHDTLIKVNNTDYSKVIDSLNNQSYLLIDSLESACNDRESGMSDYYRKELLKTQKQITAFKAQYSPCKPDTIQTTIVKTFEDLGHVAALQTQLDRVKADSIKKEQQLSDLHGKVKSKNNIIWDLLIALLIAALWIFRKPLLTLIKFA